MDENLNQQNQAPTPAATDSLGAAQTSPVTPPLGTTPPQMDPPKSGNKMILLAILVFVMFIIVIGIYFFALQYNAPRETPQPTPAPTIPSSPTPTPTPTLDEKDIDSVDIPNPETELKPIDEDVKQL